MKMICTKARAKINLNLEIISKRKDNYHNIESVFQRINLYDRIYIWKNKKDNVVLKTNIDTINNKDNIMYRAYQILKEEYPSIGGVTIKLKKNIPMQAGLGGGSADCASFIMGMNKLFNLRLSEKNMQEIGKKLGADVVPCFYNGAFLAKGIGNEITPIESKCKYYILVIKPEISCNTKEMYQKIDEKKLYRKNNKTDNIIKGLKNNDLNLIANNLYNQFETVIQNDGTIIRLKDTLKKSGAIGALMTGSDSCVYGIYKRKMYAKRAYRALKNEYQIYFCVTYNKK